MRADLMLENALVTWDGTDAPEQLQYGQILPEEGMMLREAAQEVPTGQVIIELGSYTGKSTCCLARGSFAGQDVPVYAVDLWTSGTSRKGRNFRVRRPDEQVRSSKFHTPEVLAVFRRRMEVYSEGLVHECMGASVDVAATFPHQRSCGLLFIDAEHTYEACRADFEAWVPKVVAGGVIMLHDYKGEGAGGVKRYVDEVLQEGGWRIREQVGSLVVLER
jgi:MMP 1-O-methyltransferase